jgi:hypothetical protein
VTALRCAGLRLKFRDRNGFVFVADVCIEGTYSWMTVCGELLQVYVQWSVEERSCAQGFGRETRGKAESSSHILVLRDGSLQSHRGKETESFM